MARPDVLLVSLGTTLGWRRADGLLLGQIERAGASKRTAYGIGSDGSSIAAVVEETIRPRGSCRSTAVRAVRRAAYISTRSLTG